MLNNPIKVLSETELLGRKFTVYGTAENPLFKAKEVAEVIEHPNVTVMLNLVDEEEKGVKQLLTPGGNQQVWFLTEDGLYEVLMQSRKPIAKEFKKGVKEILKTIRKTGGYIATTAEDSPEEIMARALTIAQATLAKREERLKQLEAQAEQQKKQIEQKDARISKLQPKADFADVAFKAEGKVDIGQAAKILGLPFGRNTLFKKLKVKGILFNRNEPKQRYIDAGYFELTQLPPIHRNNHPDIIVMKVICTQKGLAFINKLFGGSSEKTKLATIR